VSGTPEPVSVRILDREYTVGADADERDNLMGAARLLDARMREIRGNNRMVALDRLAVLAALNLAHELLQLRTTNAWSATSSARSTVCTTASTRSRPAALSRRRDSPGRSECAPASAECIPRTRRLWSSARASL
jgi:cell division protein ZapA